MLAKEHCFLFPYNGNTIEALSCLPENFEFLGFIDDNPNLNGTTLGNFKVFSRDILNQYPHAKILAVPGSPDSYAFRDKIIEGINLFPSRRMNAIHKTVSVSPFATLGYNVLLMPGVVIMPNVHIGNHVCILPNTVVHHDSVIEAYCLLGSNVTIAGNVFVGASSYIGSGTSVKNGLSIGAGTLVGMGSVVIRSIAQKKRVAGCPAKEL